MMQTAFFMGFFALTGGVCALLLFEGSSSAIEWVLLKIHLRRERKRYATQAKR